MASKQIAVHVTMSAELRSDFAREFLSRRIGPDVFSDLYASLPTYRSGVSKGEVKGFLLWEKVSVGGWSNAFGVLRPGSQELRISASMFASSSDCARLKHFDSDSPDFLIDAADRASELPGMIRRVAEVLKK